MINSDNIRKTLSESYQPTVKSNNSDNNKSSNYKILSDLFGGNNSSINSNNNSDKNIFTHKKQKYRLKTEKDIEDMFDPNQMLPQETDEDWFDTAPLQAAKKIEGVHMIHPKVHMGINTSNGFRKNPSHDIRGDIPNPKIHNIPFLNSTIEPDENIRGLC